MRSFRYPLVPASAGQALQQVTPAISFNTLPAAAPQAEPRAAANVADAGRGYDQQKIQPVQLQVQQARQVVLPGGSTAFVQGAAGAAPIRVQAPPLPQQPQERVEQQRWKVEPRQAPVAPPKPLYMVHATDACKVSAAQLLRSLVTTHDCTHQHCEAPVCCSPGCTVGPAIMQERAVLSSPSTLA